MNKAIMVGYMAANPENKVSQNGTSVTTFRISVKKRMPPKGDGPKYNYFNCVAFKHTADYVYKYCNNQSKVAVCGYIENESYTDKNGVKRYVTKLYVEEAEILSSTVNQGDFQPQEQPAQGGAFMDVTDEEVDLPFI